MKNLKPITNTELSNMLNKHILELLDANPDIETPIIKIIYKEFIYETKLNTQEKHEILEEFLINE